ncbi:hypothetical protein ARMSODRAFT_1017650 [Armillaria solidipes]|uniref:Uncharacterized protein n=1 Tax=Armillaria solidipes TaxID=1076256 RepID=A0A2H3BV63_9AGAR|nr:hypothetical protein ARMSODRAFT_1017650 [Armillaria solidipes]
MSTDGPATATPTRYQHRVLLPAPGPQSPPPSCIPHFRHWGITDIRSIFSPDVVTTTDNNNNSGSPFPPHPAPSIDCTSTIEPLPPFPILGNPMVTVVSPHELPTTLYGPVDPYLTP